MEASLIFEAREVHLQARRWSANTLVQAMSAYDMPQMGQTTLTDAYQAQLSAVLGNWA